MKNQTDRFLFRSAKTCSAGLRALALGVAMSGFASLASAADLPPQGGGGAQGQMRAHSANENRLAPAAAQPSMVKAESASAVQRTDVKDDAGAAYERLLNNSGIGLQWLWTDARGKLNAVDDNGVVRLEGGHATDAGSVSIKGEVVSISADRFTFRGTILILDAPEKGRRCERTGDHEFRATGKRKYWRLQDMTVCGGLTDYVDIYY